MFFPIQYLFIHFFFFFNIEIRPLYRTIRRRFYKYDMIILLAFRSSAFVLETFVFRKITALKEEQKNEK